MVILDPVGLTFQAFWLTPELALDLDVSLRFARADTSSAWFRRAAGAYCWCSPGGRLAAVALLLVAGRLDRELPS